MTTERLAAAILYLCDEPAHMEATLADRRNLDRPRIYELHVEGVIDAAWARYWLEGFVVTPLPNDESLLTGPVADQSALLGLLARLRDFGLPLVSVRQTGHRAISKEDTSNGKNNAHA